MSNYFDLLFNIDYRLAAVYSFANIFGNSILLYVALAGVVYVFGGLCLLLFVTMGVGIVKVL